MKRDQVIFDLIEKEHQRQLKGIELIASENFVSDEVMEAMGSYLTNKYAEGYPGKRYYGGCQVVDEVETLAIERVKKLFGAEYANVQPHSGAQANAAVLLAVLKPGDTFLGLNLAHGGHLSHGSAVNTSGILYHAIGYDLDKETGRVNYDQMEQLALEHSRQTTLTVRPQRMFMIPQPRRRMTARTGTAPMVTAPRQNDRSCNKGELNGKQRTCHPSGPRAGREKRL